MFFVYDLVDVDLSCMQDTIWSMKKDELIADVKFWFRFGLTVCIFIDFDWSRTRVDLKHCLIKHRTFQFPQVMFKTIDNFLGSVVTACFQLSLSFYCFLPLSYYLPSFKCLCLR